MKAHDKLQAKLEAKQAEEQRVRFGDRVNPVPDMNASVPVTNELNRLFFERGRVWRRATVTQATANDLTLQLTSDAPGNPAAPAAGGENAAPAATGDFGLAKESIVQAFGERNDELGNTLPVEYLGEFLVSASDATTIKLRPTAELTKEQTASINSGSFPTWSIYELMPLDSHEAFAAIGSQAEENAIFGRMDLQEIAQLLGIDPSLATATPTTLKLNEAIKARVVQSYLNDGGRPPEGTPQEQIYLRVEFLKDHTTEVDAQEQRIATEGGFYDLSGRSVDARLKRGEEGAKVSFKSGSVVVIDSSSAEDLIKQGIVKQLAPIYVRPLNDYEYAFREVRRQITASLQDVKLIKRELEVMKNSQEIVSGQVIQRQQERDKLDKDFAQYTKEHEVIRSEAERLEQELSTTRSNMSSMFQQIQALRDQIVASQQAITQAIDAVAPAPDR